MTMWIIVYFILMLAYLMACGVALEERIAPKKFIARLMLLSPVWPIGLVWVICISVDKLLEMAELKK